MTKITLDRNECIGCQACMSVCGKYIKYNEEDNKVSLKGASGKGKQEIEVTDKKCAKEAEDICPVDAIKVI